MLAGRVPYFDVTEYIQLADLCLLSFEINEITRGVIPQKLTEYLAMKKPVLSNCLPGVLAEIGKNNGVIFADNQKELIKKIGILSSKKEKLKKIGFDGYKFVKKNYSWSKIIMDFIEIMLDAIRMKN